MGWRRGEPLVKGLIVGVGSIGKRHLRNLHAAGIDQLGACDADATQLSPLIAEFGIRPFTDLDVALGTLEPDFVFICTPPVFHVRQALEAVRAGAHVFIEKPLSNSLDNVDELVAETAARRRIVQVGYNLRFHVGLQEIKRLLDNDAVGRILWARIEVAQYLPDWRPGQDYRHSYTARRDLGGGIILDASHELDYAIWLLGQPTEVMCMAGKVSDLQTDVEDCATVLLRFASGAQADVHMDFVQRGYARSCKLAGESGTVSWDYSANQVRVYKAETGSWEETSYAFKSNDMYVAEVRHFLECVTQATPPAVDLKQAKKVLEVSLAAKAAAAHGSLERITCSS
jgi:predicted dehydrogenase